MGQRLLFLVVFALAAGIAGAQPPSVPGSGTQAIQGGGTLSVPLPKPSARDLEIQRLQEEYGRKADAEQEAKETAQFRNSQQAAYYCKNMLEPRIREVLEDKVRAADDSRPLNAQEKKEALAHLTAMRDKYCR